MTPQLVMADGKGLLPHHSDHNNRLEAFRATSQFAAARSGFELDPRHALPDGTSGAH